MAGWLPRNKGRAEAGVSMRGMVTHKNVLDTLRSLSNL